MDLLTCQLNDDKMMKLNLWTNLKQLFSFSSTLSKAATVLYKKITTQARHFTFYSDFNVPDTVRGRYEMVCLHLFIVLYRLKSSKIYEKKKAAFFSQQLCDLVVADFDHSLRALRITDSTIVSSYKKAVEGFYGRLSAYDKAVENDDPRHLRRTLSRNVYGENIDIESPVIHSLETYVRRCLEILSTQNVNNLNFEESTEDANPHNA